MFRKGGKFVLQIHLFHAREDSTARGCVFVLQSPFALR
jgi:hypothetical protein